jgi:hypothetical protein
MFRVTGRLVAKSLIKEGKGEWGDWQLVQFIIQKQYRREKIKIVFVSFGKVAKTVQDMALKEKITVKFYPKCNEHEGKYYTELKALDVDKWVSQKRLEEASQEGAEPLFEEEYTPQQDNQLFDKEDLE